MARTKRKRPSLKIPLPRGTIRGMIPDERIDLIERINQRLESASYDEGLGDGARSKLFHVEKELDFALITAAEQIRKITE